MIHISSKRQFCGRGHDWPSNSCGLPGLSAQRPRPHEACPGSTPRGPRGMTSTRVSASSMWANQWRARWVIAGHELIRPNLPAWGRIGPQPAQCPDSATIWGRFPTGFAPNCSHTASPGPARRFGSFPGRLDAARIRRLGLRRPPRATRSPRETSCRAAQSREQSARTRRFGRDPCRVSIQCCDELAASPASA